MGKFEFERIGKVELTTNDLELVVEKEPTLSNVGVNTGSGRQSRPVTLIKDITGGDKITARFLNREFFEFYPEFKLFLGTNHKPIIRGTDHAIWDRIRLIPFTVKLPKNEQIPKTELFEMFQSEIDGIFSWLVAGCLKWRTEGLGMPEEVKAATNNYRNEMDLIQGFINDECVIGDSLQSRVKDLYVTYERWSNESGEKPVSKKMFGVRLDEKGFDSYRATGGIRLRLGIGIKISDA